MNVLLLGSGGRESAIAYKIRQSQKCEQLFIAPGNGGTGAYGTNLQLNINDFNAVKQAVLAHNISLVVVGPEEPLVLGIHDFFAADSDLQGVKVIGPKKAGAQLEGSKDFSKRFMQRHNIPTAAYKTFTAATMAEGLDYLTNHSLPVVLKADGLAAGKGVLIIDNTEEAREAFKDMLGGKFGQAGAAVVIEEFLQGIELSVFVLTDGKGYCLLPEAKDYKRIGQGDTGLNTGGMGSVSPVPFATPAFIEKVRERIIQPTLQGLQTEGIEYTGFIFFGLINVNGEPFVIEYNCRMGDPETESVFMRIESDVLEMFEMAGNATLSSYHLQVSNQVAATVIMVAGGYPEAYDKGKAISGMENVRHSMVFQAGTVLDGAETRTAGGRVLAITALGPDMFTALQHATADAGRIYWDGKYFREDIGFDLLGN